MVQLQGGYVAIIQHGKEWALSELEARYGELTSMLCCSASRRLHNARPNRIFLHSTISLYYK